MRKVIGILIPLILLLPLTGCAAPDTTGVDITPKVNFVGNIKVGISKTGTSTAESNYYQIGISNSSETTLLVEPWQYDFESTYDLFVGDLALIGPRQEGIINLAFSPYEWPLLKVFNEKGQFMGEITFVSDSYEIPDSYSYAHQEQLEYRPLVMQVRARTD